MSSCDRFTQNAWRPDLCSTCQRAKSEHEGVTGPRSWRRRSEPNPNNAITGVRISALASKFQGRDTRSGSIPEAEVERARTLDRKYPKSKAKRLNASRSTDLLDTASLISSSISSSSSQKTSTTSISAISSSSFTNQTKSVNSQEKDSKPSTATGLLGKHGCAEPNSAGSHPKTITKVSKSSVVTTNPNPVKKSFQSGTPGAKTAVSQAGGQSGIKSNLPRQSIETSHKTVSSSLSNNSSTSHSSSSILSKQDSSSALKKPKGDFSDSAKDSQTKSKPRRVSIPDAEPEVIGNDGGLDNLMPEGEEAVGAEETEQIYLSLTDEEKQFALLALGNTVWNSDTRNLQVESEVAKRSCREFEDLKVEKLWTGERFQTLINCDNIKKQQDFGTFPQINSSKHSKISLENLNFPSTKIEDKKVDSKTVRMADTEVDGGAEKDRGSKGGVLNDSHGRSQGHMNVERLKSGATSGNSSMTSLSSDPDGKGNYGSSYGSADSGVEMGGEPKERPLSYTLGDITDCLYVMPDETGPLAEVKNASKTSGGKGDNCDGSSRGRPPVKTRSVNSNSADGKSPSHTQSQGYAIKVLPKKNPPVSHSTSVEEGEVTNLDLSLNDSMAIEGFQAIALLNDVLRDYGDLNESSTDDLDAKDSKKDALKAKKSSDFEARMASVAATLDLTKQQQRGKRQAPRPPVSPPPEPTSSNVVSPKKVSNQPDPVFKMVTVGKNIMTLPQQADVPKTAKPSQAPPGLEEFVAVSESTDSLNNRTNGDAKNKKGITSFFRNILRRGKDSTESFETMNPDVQLSAKYERKDSSGGLASGSVDLPDDDPGSSSVDRKLGPKFSPQAKFLVIPPASVSSPQHKRGDAGTTNAGADGATDVSNTDPQTQHPQHSAISTTASSSSAAATPSAPVSASPPTQRKTSKGLASPKMMLKKATAKFSPPTSRHASKDKESADLSASTTAKPYPAPKPVVPPPTKPPLATTTSTGSVSAASATAADKTSKEKDGTTAPNVIRRRAKSPKRTAPPVPPTRVSVGPGKATGSDSRNPDLAKELEWRLTKSVADQSGGGTLSRSELRDSTRRSMPIPPSPPGGERKDKSSTTGRTVSPSPSVSPIRETENSLPSSPSSPTGTSFDFGNTEWSGGSTSTIDDELPKFTEKIELPTVADKGRKGFLGKLGGNRKTRAPAPPSVKRAKSITESSTLPRGDKKSKKINVADISGPVMVTDITNTKVLENRRNTISLGDEPGFVVAPMNPGAAPATAPVDKGGFDEFDFPVLSPLGSLENLYESILPKQDAGTFHYYDPPTSPKVLCPNIPADGYLEPVPPLSTTTAVAAPPSSSSSLLSAAVAAGLSSPSSGSSASSATTNVSVVKSPLKSKMTGSRSDKNPPFSSTGRDVSSSSSGNGMSTSSSEANSAENSGNSLPDVAQLSLRIHAHLDNQGNKNPASNTGSSSGVGPTFVEPELTEQRRILLASQPIYEEIPNGNNENENEEDENYDTVKEEEMKWKKMGGKSEGTLKKTSSLEAGNALQKIMLPNFGGSELTKSQVAHAWLQQSHAPGAPPQTPPPTSSAAPSSLSSSGSLSLATSTHTAFPTSPSHTACKPNQAPTSLSLSSSMSASQMTSSIMTTSLTSSMLPPPPPPPDHLPAPPPSTSRSVSRETVSSESDTQSNCSTLSRPRPAPRRKPKRPDTGGSDQYVSMNRPNAQVSLSEEKLRDTFSKLTSISFHALQDIYAQCERILSVDRLELPNSHVLKWADFDIYGQPLHASGRCVVYNAKFRANSSPCQVMILHSRPATEMCTTSHPSLLRPSAVFADTIPFSYLTPDFIKTSQLLQNSVYDSSQARCFIAVGAFDVVESLDSHLALLRETLALDPQAYLSVILTAALQLLSAMSHCLDQGFSVTENDYNDVFLVTRSDLRGKVVAFLPHQRSLEVPQGEAMCNFLDRLLTDAMPEHDDDDDVGEEEEDDEEEEGEKIISSPKKVVAKLRSMLLTQRVECLGQVRTAVEYLLWGPAQSELPVSPGGGGAKSGGGATGVSGTAGGGASREQELYVWLEKERVITVGRLAQNVAGLGAGLNLEEFYTLKFLLKSSAACLAESLRRLAR